VTPERRRALYVRLGALALVAVALLIVGTFTPLGSYFSTAKIRTLATSAGSWGVVIYLGLWMVGNLVYVPGLVFVAAGVLAWGHWWGGLAAYCGAFLAAICSFTIVRAVGGKPLAEITNPRILRILNRIEKRPILSVAFVRSFSMSAPALNYALALSPIPWVPHLIGTVFGLIPSVGVISALFGVLFK
jgi:uncharacterized membrane protein YdjX (TVP38/TMEM64 family)